MIWLTMGLLFGLPALWVAYCLWFARVHTRGFWRGEAEGYNTGYRQGRLRLPATSQSERRSS